MLAEHCQRVDRGLPACRQTANDVSFYTKVHAERNDTTGNVVTLNVAKIKKRCLECLVDVEADVGIALRLTPVDADIDALLELPTETSTVVDEETVGAE